MQAQNTADTSPEQFANLATGTPVEAMLSRLQHYADIGLVRVGEPEITDVEVEVNGSSATVIACLNEDDWSATLNGVPEPPPKLGPKPWGAKASKSDDTRLIVETTNAPEGSLAC